MSPLRNRLDKAAKKTGLRLDVIQQDYLLSWVLNAIFQHDLLKSSLIFKGGTALKKCYFGEYRFSEDLDFSATPNFMDSSNLFSAIHESILNAERQMREHSPMKLLLEKYVEKESYPNGQEAFQVRAQFPWQREPLTVVMIEISRDELILLPPALRKLIHEYGETIETYINVYSLEEVILEKLRAILQHSKKLHERDWNRSRARDFYDLWSIFKTFHSDLNTDKLSFFLRQKCTHKHVIFTDESSFFNDVILANVSQTWDQWLGPLVQHLPPYEIVIDELRPKITSLLNNARS